MLGATKNLESSPSRAAYCDASGGTMFSTSFVAKGSVGEKGLRAAGRLILIDVGNGRVRLAEILQRSAKATKRSCQVLACSGLDGGTRNILIS